MRIAEVIGTVTLNRCLPEFNAARLRLVRPLSLPELRGQAPPAADPLVAWDELCSGLGDWIAISEGAEAAQPFRPQIKPVDCYNAAILDNLQIEEPTGK